MTALNTDQQLTFHTWQIKSRCRFTPNWWNLTTNIWSVLYRS